MKKVQLGTGNYGKDLEYEVEFTDKFEISWVNFKTAMDEAN